MQDIYTQTHSSVESLEVSKVLRNTYALLAVTLLFSAVCAVASMAMGIGYGASMIMSFSSIGLLWFVLPRTANSSKGILVVFAVTGLLGAGLGPILNRFMAMDGGAAMITQAFGGTALIFFGLSGYVLVTRKDFSFITGFLMTGIMIAFIAMIANIFFQIPALSLAISALFMFISSGLILWQTSQIIHGGERNYILATASLYVSLYNIFVSLLHILGFAGGDD
ncbi:MAG: BAX inhibitor protein [Alteromonadaceae bacterium]|nr:MAG: BAX inhibitor protein [Alteromonadaceae bacterium]